MIECVVLDCDGVILETVELKTEAFAKSARHLGPEAVRTLIDFHRAHGGVSRYEKYRHLWREVFGREISDEEMADMVDRFIAAAADALVECPLVPGVLDFLNEWSARMPLYVASGAPDEELKYILKVKNLSSHFKGIHGSPTPKAELLAAIVAREGVAPERTLMVGDSGTDLDAARRVGTLFYGRGPFPPPLPWGEDLRGLSAFVAAHSATD